MKIAIDIDGTINANENSVEFFRALTRSLISQNEIYIISNRNPDSLEDVEEELTLMGIKFTKVILTNHKAQVIKARGITVFYENEDEYFNNLGSDVLVFKVREKGNYNYMSGRWYGSKNTVEMIDE